jgi:hypothetical protein
MASPSAQNQDDSIFAEYFITNVAEKAINMVRDEQKITAMLLAEQNL